MTLLFWLPVAVIFGGLLCGMAVAIVHLLSKGSGEPITPTKRRVESGDLDLSVRRAEDDTTEADP